MEFAISNWFFVNVLSILIELSILFTFFSLTILFTSVKFIFGLSSLLSFFKSELKALSSWDVKYNFIFLLLPNSFDSVLVIDLYKFFFCFWNKYEDSLKLLASR